MIIPLETEFSRLCSLVSDSEIRKNPRAKKKLIQMKKTLVALANAFGQVKKPKNEFNQKKHQE